MNLVGVLPVVAGVVLTVVVVDGTVVAVVLGAGVVVDADVVLVEDIFDVVEGVSVGLVGFTVVVLYLSISC